MINVIWGEFYSNYFSRDSKEEHGGDVKGEEDQDKEEDDQAPQTDPSDLKSNSDKYLYKQASVHEISLWRGLVSL